MCSECVCACMWGGGGQCSLKCGNKASTVLYVVTPHKSSTSGALGDSNTIDIGLEAVHLHACKLE